MENLQTRDILNPTKVQKIEISNEIREFSGVKAHFWYYVRKARE